MRNPFKKLAALCVTAYANRLYRSTAKMAEKKRTETCTKQYVLSAPLPVWSNQLIIVSAKEFQKIRHHFGVPTGTIPSDVLIRQSWYHTSGRSGQGGISKEEAEVRRLAFCRYMLKRANLA